MGGGSRRARAPRVRAKVIGAPDSQDLYFAWHKLRGTDEDGALLVRPDGVIAWRSVHSVGEGAQQALSEALTAILGVNISDLSHQAPMVNVP